MLRKLVLLALLANLVLWAWSHGLLAGFGWAPARVGEPQRLRDQVDAQALQLLGPDGTPLATTSSSPAASTPASSTSAPAASASAASTPAAAASASSRPAAPSSAPRASTPARATPATPAASAASAASGSHAMVAATAAAATTCLRIGPYAGPADAALGSALRAAGLAAQERTQNLPEQWMVLMGPYASAAEQQRKLGELQRLALPSGSFVPVTGRPRYMPGIALGVFDHREQAQLQIKHLQARGVQTAHVVQRNLGMQGAYWVLPALDASQAQRLRELPALRAAGVHAQDCPAN